MVSAPLTNLPPDINARTSPEVLAKYLEIEARERSMDETIWAKERLAEECGRTLEDFWDRLNHSTNKMAEVSSLEFESVRLPKWQAPRSLPHDIFEREPSAGGSELSFSDWRGLRDKMVEAGWQLEQCEFRQNSFETEPSGTPLASVFYFSAHLLNSAAAERAVLEGDLHVHWSKSLGQGELIAIKGIDASRVTLKTRNGRPPFRRVLEERLNPVGDSHASDPMLVYDLDGDGRPEIIFVARNVVYKRDVSGAYRAQKLCRFPANFISSAVVGDFDGDGTADLLCAKYEGLFLFHGSRTGEFEQPARPVALPQPQLMGAMVMTCGDVDGDGDLDIFLGQYKEPYEQGRTPRPYFDANDGYPAFLFLNDGQGNFADRTQSSGLALKRFRRTYSASFVDLDHDGGLDLVVVSDFAGIDIYKNDGKGNLRDCTAELGGDSHAFGMAHAISDFDSDGNLDILMTGMTSPTVERIEHLGLWRNDAPDERAMRKRMTAGNRLYLGRPEGAFHETPLSESIARSGWSWGCSPFDFDNDGYPDVYIANGLESNRSVRDYEAEYWLHDKYIESDVGSLYFKSKITRTRGREYSYGGYDSNRFYINRNGTSFFESAFLMGIASGKDSRNVVATDLDGDGKVDLLFTTIELWPEVRQTVFIYKNELAETGNWIGFRFQGNKSRSPIGATVSIQTDNGLATRAILTGDSYRSQHPFAAHFGLGTNRFVRAIEVRWPNGQLMSVPPSGINREYLIQ